MHIYMRPLAETFQLQIYLSDLLGEVDGDLDRVVRGLLEKYGQQLKS